VGLERAIFFVLGLECARTIFVTRADWYKHGGDCPRGLLWWSRGLHFPKRAEYSFIPPAGVCIGLESLEGYPVGVAGLVGLLSISRRLPGALLGLGLARIRP